jgi:hypothetical protein
MLSRAWVALLALTLGLSVSLPAHAEKKCEQWDRSGAVCAVWTGDPAGGSTPTGDDPKSRRAHRALECIDHTFYDPTRALPCTSPFGEWSNHEQCYLKLYAGEPTDPQLTRRFHCFSPSYSGNVDTRVVNTVYPTGQVDPETLARAVAASLRLHAINIGLAPHANSTGLVQLPVWMWAADPDGPTWGPASASKTEQGLTVVVKAIVDHVEWDMGDGTTVTCGVGTARPAGGGTSESPDCGHTYTTTSADRKSGSFTVTATSHWTISWTAGAQHGSFPFELSDTAQLAIIESRPVLTAP